MSTLNQIHGGGSGPVNDEGKEKPKPGKDRVQDTAEFFERMDRHRPRKTRVHTNFARR